MDRFKELYDQMDIILSQTETTISVDNICKITVELMKMAEPYKELKGSEKKELILRVLAHLIRNHIESDHVEFVVLEVVQMVVPSMIDTIIAFDKGKLFVNLPKKLRKCSGKLFGCSKYRK